MKRGTLQYVAGYLKHKPLSKTPFIINGKEYLL